MTLDELKAELEALLARIDDPLAEEIRKAYDDPPRRFDGQCFEVIGLLPRDLSILPEYGYRVRLSIGAWFIPVVYNYVEPHPAKAALTATWPGGGKIRVVLVERTCEACPSQWEGDLADGRTFYARYRCGLFSLSLGDVPIIEQQVGGPLDGDMTDEEMRHLTRDVLDWTAVSE